MTPDERSLLTTFIRDLNQARAGAKDPEADQIISQAMASNPDAAYLLIQHTILSDQALHASQERITQLEEQLRASTVQSPPPSFLGGSTTAVPPTSAPGASPFAPSGGLGSFLRNAGTTAAGVVGGEMLFQGLSGLFGGHAGFGMGGFGGGYGAPVENVTINDYGDNGGLEQGSDWSDGSDDFGS